MHTHIHPHTVHACMQTKYINQRFESLTFFSLICILHRFCPGFFFILNGCFLYRLWQIYNHTYITFLDFSIYASNHMYRIYMYENQGAGKGCISAGIIPEKKISSTSRRSPIENRQTAPAVSLPHPPFPPAQHLQLIEWKDALNLELFFLCLSQNKREYLEVLFF